MDKELKEIIKNKQKKNKEKDMRKLFNKSVVILAIFMCCSLLLGIACKLDWNVAKASMGNLGGYTNLTYQELDDITYRSTESSSPAQITVFTHGLGGTPSHWSNQSDPIEGGFGEYKFEYDDKSMPEQLREKMEDNGQQVVMYTAKVAIAPLLIQLTEEEIKAKEETENINLNEEDKKYYKTSISEDEWKSEPVSDSITNQKAGPESHQALYEKYFANTTGNEEPKCAQLVELKKQETTGYVSTGGISTNALTADDVSKHIILIFEAVDPDASNDYVYAQLEYILDVISYQYLQLTGVLPTYNMIAHSRGGLTNMQYALAHPYNVASLYSVGTPYSGSAFGSAALDVGMDKNHIFLSIAGYSREDVTYEVSEGEENIDECPSNFSPGVLDIIDAEAIESYKTYWNAHYDDFYSHIDFNPLGSYVTFGFVLQLVVDYVETAGGLDGLGDMKDSAVNVLNTICLVAETRWGGMSFLMPDYLQARIENSLIDATKDFVLRYFNNRDRIAWLEVLNNFRTIPVSYAPVARTYAYSPTFVIADDLFIDLNSQIALGYTGAKVRVCLMDSIDQIEGRARKNVDMAGVAHNFEVRHPDIVRYIVEDLVGESSEPYNYRYTKDGYYITSMNYDMSTGGVLTLPSAYNGKPVIGIDGLKHDIIIGGNERYYPNITKVVIPNSIKEISDYAFYGMSNLTTIEFEEGTQLNEIGIGAFMNCSSLPTFAIPDLVTQIGKTAFTGCESLVSFAVGNNNAAFSVEDGVLLNKDKTQLLCYPEGKGATYTVPMTVTEIMPSAFIGNETLTTIDLNEVKTIRMFAFSNCTNLATITSNNLEIVEWGVLDGTAWLEAQTNDEVILGKVLLAYQGNDTEVVLEDITSIAPFAFENNETLASVTFTGDLVNIGISAFAGCTRLESVYVCNAGYFVYIGNNTFDNNAEGRTIYVPYWQLDEYLANEIWQQYESDISVHKTAINFDSQGGSTCENETVYYQDYLDLPTPTRNGYTFIGWYADAACTGTALNEQTRWDSLSDTVTLYADWEPIRYSIIYVTEYTADGDVLDSYVSSYTIEENVVYDIPEKKGYIFGGWYKDIALTELAGSGFETGNTGHQTLYAKWDALTYEVTYNLSDDTKFPASISSTTGTVVFGSSDYQFAVPTRTGFTFNGWKVLVNGLYEFYTNEAGCGNQEWDIADNVTAVADWTRHTYYIKINTDGTFTWLGEDGFSSTETSIEYGSVFNSASDLETNFNPEKKSLKEGHKFDYFELSNGVKFEQWAQIASMYGNGDTVELTAQFEREVSFSIHYLNDEFIPEMADYGETIELARQADLTGYKFSHWIVAPVSEVSGNARFVGTPYAPGEKFSYTSMPDLSYGVEEDLVTIWLKAVQVQTHYQVTLKTAFGTVSPSVVMLEYDKGFELPVPSNVAGREFLGWCLNSLKNEHRSEFTILGTPITDENGQSLSTWQYQEEVTLDAAWHTIAYQITCDLNGGNYPEGVTNLNWYMVDDLTITLSNPTRSGYKFMGWKNDDTGEISITTRIPQGSVGDKNYTAQWAKLYTISFDSNYGSSCDSITIEENATITLPTSTHVGYTGTWDGYDFGSTYTVTGDRTFTAVWTGNIYTITFDRNGGDTGTISAEIHYGNTMPIITLPTRSGYRFDYYTDSSGNQYYINEGNETRTYLILGNLTLTAHWTESYLEIENLGKSGTKWSIKITNNSSTAVTVYYNKKMCYLTDAKNWTGLKDVNKTPIEIISGGSATVTISENWFATSITVSYVTSDGIRMVTYADGLTTSGGMNVKMNKIG